ncbi:unnamed protein product [Heligmosomoides polygyrus]|uniref:L-serine deaminase n=1 Tax=Heligmosomoides polygyrus TaxID=6339 RepID=A0A183FR24_HELPZ|nr:unnamed protein product [Heligmosomoides polygyrus]
MLSCSGGGRAAIRHRPLNDPPPCRLTMVSVDIENGHVDMTRHQENLQTGTFKDRGARNALMCLNEEERKKGVYVASTGSFGRAVAYHGKELGIPVTVVLTRFASMTTLTHCLNYGAQVVVEGISHVESSEAALRLALNNGGKFINGHDNLDSMAGAGTVAVEILEEVPDLDAIFVPVGGAGLFAATVVAVKAMSPKTKVIGLEAQTCPALMAS